MAESITLARPYAKAAFEVALAANELSAWSQALSLLANVAASEQVRRHLLSPALTAAQQSEIGRASCRERV